VIETAREAGAADALDHAMAMFKSYRCDARAAAEAVSAAWASSHVMSLQDFAYRVASLIRNPERRSALMHAVLRDHVRHDVVMPCCSSQFCYRCGVMSWGSTCDHHSRTRTSWR